VAVCEAVATQAFHPLLAVFQPQLLAAVFQLRTRNVDELIKRLNILMFRAQRALLRSR